MTRALVMTTVFVGVLFVLPCSAQASFLGRGAKDAAVTDVGAFMPIGSELISWISSVQRDVRERMASYAGELRDNPTGISALFFWPCALPTESFTRPVRGTAKP